MARIAFLLDPDQGHIFPIISAARSLQASHHEVFFLGIEDIRPFVPHAETSFHAVFQTDYPAGFLALYKRMQSENSASFAQNTVPRPHLISMLKGGLTDTLNRVAPDLLVVTFSLAIEALLIRLVYPALNVAMFTTWLRGEKQTPASLALTTLSKLAEPVKQSIFDFAGTHNEQELCSALQEVDEIIACPPEFDFPGKDYNGNVHHIWTPPFEQERSAQPEALSIPPGKKMIYASLGSQTALFKEKALAVFDVVYDAICNYTGDEYFLVMAIGKDIDPGRYTSIAEKVVVLPWANQLQVLRSAALMITHGGLGTIKECIACEVPMLVVPIVNDQFDNADRIALHMLGAKLAIDELTPDTLWESVAKLTHDPAIDAGIRRMKNTFSAYNHHHVAIVEYLLT